MTGEDGRRDEAAPREDQEHRLQREREKADPKDQDAASGPGYTARPGEDGPEEDPPATR